MSKNPKDKIVDAFLKEVLSGKSPPDLSQKILRALKNQPGTNPSSADRTHSNMVPPAALDDKVVAAETAQKSFVQTEVDAKKSWFSKTVFQVSMACGIAFAGVTIGIFALTMSGNGAGGSDVAENTNDIENDEKKDFKKGIIRPNDKIEIVTNDPVPVPDQPKTNGHKPLVGEDQDIFNSNETELVQVDLLKPSAVTTQLLSDTEIANFVSLRIENVWQEKSLQTSDDISNQEWAERVYVVIFGRSPTTAQSRSFLRIENRLEWLNGRLASENLREDFASRWSRFLSDALVDSGNRKQNVEPASQSSANFHKYVRDAVSKQMPINELYQSVLAATGSSNLDDADFNPAVGFWQSIRSPELAATHVAQSMLGQRVDCARCHDGKQSKLKQSDFWQLAAIFESVKVIREQDDVRVVNRTKLNDVAAVKVSYSDVDGNPAIAAAVDSAMWLGGEKPTSVEMLRQDLAKSIVNSESFRKGFVNRVWKEIFGAGLTSRVEDVGEFDQGIDPELLTKLSDQFAASNFDLKKLIVWIAMSKPFAQPEADEYESYDNFDRFAGHQKSNNANPKMNIRSRLELLAKAFESDSNTQEKRELIEVLGYRTNSSSSDIIEFDPMDIRVEWGVSDQYMARINQITESELSNKQKLEHIYLLARGKKPGDRQLQKLESLLAKHPDQTEEIFRNMWALLTQKTK